MISFCWRYKSIRVSEFISENESILETNVWLSRYNTLATNKYNPIILQSVNPVNPTYYRNRGIINYFWIFAIL